MSKLTNLTIQIIATSSPSVDSFVDSLTDAIIIGDLKIEHKTNGRFMVIKAGGAKLFQEHSKILCDVYEEPTSNTLQEEDFLDLNMLNFHVVADFEQSVSSEYHFGGATVQICRNGSNKYEQVTVEVDNERAITEEVIVQIVNGIETDGLIDERGIFSVTTSTVCSREVTTSDYCEKSIAAEFLNDSSFKDPLSITFDTKLRDVVHDCIFCKGSIIEVTEVCGKSRTELLKYAFA
ncbi:hypothetical protein DC915_RS03230 [Vibrio parahaemolyticus]|nr:hypothetical protein [Vibrio parahaemolyticus]EJG0009992.1 hypothetical protein [Vibrio parahaemolyticus]